MHRHGYQGRKFGRERDQRGALMMGLVSNLIEHGKIETTVPKAKELVPAIEKLITKAKQADLAGRRQVIASVTTLDIAHKLFDDIAPQLTKRNSGHVRLVKTGLRRGDNAAMAEVSFVDTLTSTTPADKPARKSKVAPKKAAKKDKEPVKPTTQVRGTTPEIATKQVNVAKKRTGVRGNR